MPARAPAHPSPGLALHPRRGILDLAGAALSPPQRARGKKRTGNAAGGQPRLDIPGEEALDALHAAGRVGLRPTPGRGRFLACTIAWPGEVHAMQGRWEEALAGLAGDTGLLVGECEAGAGRQVGNLPRAFPHPGLVGLAMTLLRHPA